MEFTRETALLTSHEAGHLLQTALTGDPEVVLPGFTARLDDLHYRPGAEVTAVYTATWQEGVDTRTDHLLVTTAEVIGDIATLTSDGLTLRVWRHPADPRLPGLVSACDAGTVISWLTGTGADAPARFSLDLLAYRPLRRAVLRADADGQEFYLKVLRPGRDDTLALRHDLLAAQGLTVPVLARPAPGVLVTPRAPGLPLGNLLAGGAAVDPADLLDLLDRLPDSLLDLPRRPSWSDRIEVYADAARHHLPSASHRIDDLTSRIATTLAAHRDGPPVPTHGDCYEANIFLDADAWRFIDVDSAGPGRREDDLACALAHLAVLPVIDPTGWAGVPPVIDAWRDAFSRVVEPGDLHARTAAVLISLIASVPAGNGTAVLDLAEHHLRAGAP